MSSPTLAGMEAPPAAAAAASSSGAQSSSDAQEEEEDRQSTSRSREPHKGLRHLATLVRFEVEERRRTTCDAVAEALVASAGESRAEKNVRRRVYEALNVLIATKLISRDDRKRIHWSGAPADETPAVLAARRRLDDAYARVAAKRRHLQDIVGHHACLQQLAARNRAAAEPASKRQALDSERCAVTHALHTPFLVIAAPNDAKLLCETNASQSRLRFKTNQPFQLTSDVHLTKHLYANDRLVEPR